jgi:UDP-GlcNAc:undecaprenyl-phosphate GlcNAc-1-phosphate transferase
MNLLKNLIFLPLFVSFFISFIITPLVIFIYRKLGWVEKPHRQRDTHTYPVPRGGGIPIWVALILASIIFLPQDQHWRGIIAGASLLAFMGILDDRLDLNPYLRLLGCFLTASLVIAAGIGIPFITNPFGGIIKLDQPRVYFYFLGETRSIWVLADIFALIWIVFLTNIVNWSKWFDGQLPGIVVIAALTIAFLALRFSADIAQWPVAILASITAGAYLGFLPFNFYPQKIMPGYGGGSLAGFLLAVLAILSTTKVGTAIVVLGIPFIDALYSISRRIASGRSPVWGDRGHLHHKILDEWKWGKRKAAAFYWTLTAILGFLALNLSSLQKFYTIVMLTVIIGGLFLWFKFWKTFSAASDQGRHSKT